MKIVLLKYNLQSNSWDEKVQKRFSNSFFLFIRLLGGWKVSSNLQYAALQLLVSLCSKQYLFHDFALKVFGTTSIHTRFLSGSTPDAFVCLWYMILIRKSMMQEHVWLADWPAVFIRYCWLTGLQVGSFVDWQIGCLDWQTCLHWRVADCWCTSS